MKKRIYIAGCGGMLGEAFYKQFNKYYELKCTDIDINEKWLSYMDFRDYEKYRDDVLSFKPDWLFHLGAHTDLEYCENHPDDTYETNTHSVEYGVQIANELDIPILYICTAGIFDGNKPVYDENDTPAPIGLYAKSKYISEVFVQKHAHNFMICRAGWMMGGGPKKDKKFVQKIMHLINSGHDTLHIVNDKLGTPTYTHDFAKNVKLLIENNQRGLFNMVCEGLTGRMEVAEELISIIGMANKINIKEVSSDYFREVYYAERPACERLINKRLNALGLNIMRDWKISLRDYIQDYYSDYLGVK